MSNRLAAWFSNRGENEWEENLAFLLGSRYDPDRAWRLGRDAFLSMIELALADPPQHDRKLLLVMYLPDTEDWEPVPSFEILESERPERPPSLAAFPSMLSEKDDIDSSSIHPVSSAAFDQARLPVEASYIARLDPAHPEDGYTRSFLFAATQPAHPG